MNFTVETLRSHFQNVRWTQLVSICGERPSKGPRTTAGSWARRRQAGQGQILAPDLCSQKWAFHSQLQVTCCLEPAHLNRFLESRCAFYHGYSYFLMHLFCYSGHLSMEILGVHIYSHRKHKVCYYLKQVLWKTLSHDKDSLLDQTSQAPLYPSLP